MSGKGVKGSARRASDGVCALCQCHISENALFTGLSDKQLDAFKDVVVFVQKKRRETVFMEGDEVGGLYIIRAGRVKLVRSSSAGKEQIIRILSPGDLLGFEVFYGAKRFENSASAMEDSELCFIGRDEFFKILEKEPGIARKLIISMGMELNGAYARIGSLGLLNAREKLAHLLSTLADEYGAPSDEGVRLNLNLSRLEIAELLGITQETGIRLLKGFSDDGLVRIKRKEIVITSLDALRRIGGAG